MRGTERRSNKSERDSTREGRREKGKHVRRLNVTEGLLFVVLWGGNELAKEGKGVGRGGGDQEEGGREYSGNSCNGRTQNVRQTCSVSLRTGASLPNKHQ